jgi:hypothetical protein
VIVHQIKLGRLATATTESGLRVKAIEPKGESLVTNMPVGIGGGNTAPTPGWYLGGRTRELRCHHDRIAGVPDKEL